MILSLKLIGMVLLITIVVMFGIVCGCIIGEKIYEGIINE